MPQALAASDLLVPGCLKDIQCKKAFASYGICEGAALTISTGSTFPTAKLLQKFFCGLWKNVVVKALHAFAAQC
jgi:hypothetical protein